jgi:hypothetical protein
MSPHCRKGMLESDFTSRRENGHANGLEDPPTGAETLTANGLTFAVVFHNSLLQGLEVLLDIGPLVPVAVRLKPSNLP